MDKKIKILIQNLALFFMAIIFSFAFAETLLRLFLPQNLNYTIFDKNLMYKHIPNFEFEYSRQEFKSIIKFNSNGLRDFEYGYEKDKNKYRILILGDSFPEALQVNLNESFSKILENNLNDKNKKYEVINTGIGGYGTENELLFFEYEGIRYEPDLVILVFAMNDIDDNLLSPLITLEDSRLSKNIPVKASLPKKLMLYCSRYIHMCALSQKVLLQGLKGNELIRIIFDKLRISTRGNNKKIALKSSLDTYLKQNSEIFDKGLNETFLAISELNKITKKNNMSFVILLMPSREQVDSGLYKKFLHEHNLNEGDVDVIKVQKFVTKFANSKNIAMVDPLNFLKERNANNSFYFNMDGHLNRAGHEAIADFLYKELEKPKFIR